MNNNKNWMQRSFSWRSLFQTFLQGIIVLVPFVITIYVVWWLFATVDDILPSIINKIFPKSSIDAAGNLRKYPGLGFLIVVVLVWFVGRISSSFMVSKLMNFLNHLLENTPGIKLIYSSVKDFIEAFAGNKRKFNKPVLVNVDGDDIWRIGFITQSSAVQFDMGGHAVVYVPHAYAISGITYMVPKHKIKRLENISPSEAMKFTVSGGVAEVE